MAELVSNSAHLTPSELTAKKEELRASHKLQLDDYDRLTNQLIERAEKDAIPQIDIDATNRRLALKEKQLRELANGMNSLIPDGSALTQQYEEEARKAEEEAKKYQKEVARKMRKEMEKEMEEKRQKEEEKKRKMDEQLRWEAYVNRINRILNSLFTWYYYKLCWPGE